MAEFGIDTTARQAAFLAQIAHESGSLRYTEEIASGRAYNDRADLGNTKPEARRLAAMRGHDTGVFYKGRGLIQITGYDNYVACGAALRIPAASNPELLKSTVNACRSAAWFWASRNLNALADAGDFERITRRINGGLNGQPERLAFYAAAQKALEAGALA